MNNNENNNKNNNEKNPSAEFEEDKPLCYTTANYPNR